MSTIKIKAITDLAGNNLISVIDLFKAPRTMANYAELRAYTGNAKTVILTDPGVGGTFVKLDTPATDDGGITIGNYRRQYTGAAQVSWFGAKGDGSSTPLSAKFSTLAEAKISYAHALALTDELDWAALQAALDTGVPIELNKGVYVCNRPLTSTNKNFSIVGKGSSDTEIRFTTPVAYGIRVSQNAAYETNIKDLFVSTNLLNAGTGISVSYAAFAGEYERNKRFANVTGNRVSGVNYFSHGWKSCFEFDEVTLPLISHNFAVGYRNLAGTGESKWWPWTEYGFLYKSSTDLSPTDVLFDGNDCRYARTAYQNIGVLEGVRYNDCLAVACKYGIVDDRREVVGAVSVDPWLMVTGCHLNVSSIGVKTYYAYQGWLTDNLVYQFTFFDETFTGIFTETGNNWKIRENHITGNKDSVHTVTGIKVQQNNRSVVSFNEIEGVDVPIECSGISGIVGTRFFMNRGYNKSGVEEQTVTYTNGASQYSNPSSIPTGIIAEGSNTAVVNVSSGSFATISTISLDTYPAGSVFRLTAMCQIFKGGTAGTTKLYVEKTSGEAVVTYMASASGLGVQNDSHAPSVNWLANLVGIIKKTTSGTLSLKLAVSSGGSNASVAASDGQFVLERIA